jgi:hypothetical protein
MAGLREGAKIHRAAGGIWLTDGECAGLLAEIDRLTEALRRIRSELGVPDEGYPAPVANAYEIADKALREVSG